MNNRYRILICIALGFAAKSVASTELWTKTFQGANYDVMVGPDGAVALADFDSSPETVYWYDNSGELISEFETNGDGFYYVTKSNVMIVDSIGHSLIYEKGDGDQVEFSKLENSLLGRYSSYSGLSYPYYLERVIESGETVLTLWTANNPDQVQIIAPLHVGATNNAIATRWISELHHVYRVQTSENLEVWSNFSEDIVGTGAVLEVSVPVSNERTYVRVLRL